MTTQQRTVRYVLTADEMARLQESAAQEGGEYHDYARTALREKLSDDFVGFRLIPGDLARLQEVAAQEGVEYHDYARTALREKLSGGGVGFRLSPLDLSLLERHSRQAGLDVQDFATSIVRRWVISAERVLRDSGPFVLPPPDFIDDDVRRVASFIGPMPPPTM